MCGANWPCFAGLGLAPEGQSRGHSARSLAGCHTQQTLCDLKVNETFWNHLHTEQWNYVCALKNSPWLPEEKPERAVVTPM